MNYSFFKCYWYQCSVFPTREKRCASVVRSKENIIGLNPAQAGQLGWLHATQELCNRSWVVSVLNYFFFPQESQELCNRLDGKLMETRGRPFKMNGVSFSGTSVCEGILLHTRLGGRLISSPFCGGCSHLKVLSAPISVRILFLFYFQFVLLTLALFCWKSKEYTFLIEDIKKMLRNRERRFLFFLLVYVSLIGP